MKRWIRIGFYPKGQVQGRPVRTYHLNANGELTIVKLHDLMELWYPGCTVKAICESTRQGYRKVWSIKDK